MGFSSPLLTKTLIHWACCKIESSSLPDDELVAVISRKLLLHKDITYTDIAHKAIDIGKKNLAVKLLELEPNIKKKIPILLWMENYEKAIVDAVYKCYFKTIKFINYNFLYEF
jgi:hypothetical protein